jgi:hypothetical protein
MQRSSTRLECDDTLHWLPAIIGHINLYVLLTDFVLFKYIGMFMGSYRTKVEKIGFLRTLSVSW